MTREERFDEARRALNANGYTCSGLRGLRFTATHESGYTIEVELRPRTRIRRDRMNMGLYMCFPIAGCHYLLPHDTLVEIVGDTTNWLNTCSWLECGDYNSENLNRAMRHRLEPFKLESPR